jgi:hypothetical protein
MQVPNLLFPSSHQQQRYFFYTYILHPAVPAYYIIIVLYLILVEAVLFSLAGTCMVSIPTCCIWVLGVIALSTQQKIHDPLLSFFLV